MNAQKFQEKHLLATEKCIEEFEKLTKHDKELNMDFETLLSYDLRGLYSSYYLLNKNKSTKFTSFTGKMKDMFYSFLGPTSYFNVKSPRKKKSLKNAETRLNWKLDPIQMTTYCFSFISILLQICLKFIFYFYDLIMNFNVNDSVFFLFILLVIKYIWLNIYDFLFYNPYISNLKRYLRSKRFVNPKFNFER